jgi:glycosyltransferase involved in cell wall biosynthesis
VLFFGRLERYKGVRDLISAWATLDDATRDGASLVLAGPGRLEPLWPYRLPPGVEVRSRHIEDREALALFRRCRLLVLPYVDATQSALVAVAYFFGKPVLVTRTGALPEYVQHGETGCIVEPGNVAALANGLQVALSETEALVRMGQVGRAWYEHQRRMEGEALLGLYASMLDAAQG